MAVTIEQSADTWTPVYNKVEFLLSSTNSANTDFSYLVDVYINGSGTKTVRLRIPIRPSDSLGEVDIHRVLETTLSSDVGDTASILGNNDASNSSLTYVVKFGEEYDVAGTITAFPDLTLTGTLYSINASLEKQEWLDFNIAAYDLSSSSDKFFTNCPSSQNVSVNNHGWLYHRSSIIVDRYYVKTYDSAGTIIATHIIDSPATAWVQYVASAPVSLNLIANGDLLSGTQPIITAATASYTIHGANNTGNTRSETKTYAIKEPCKFEESNLIFLNKLGGFDHFSFINGSSSSYAIQRKTMKVNVDNVTGTTIVHSMQDREKVQYYTKTTETIKLMSDWITEEEDAMI